MHASQLLALWAAARRMTRLAPLPGLAAAVAAACAAVVAAGAVLMAAGAVAAQPRLASRDFLLPHPPHFVRIVTWQAKPALMAVFPSAAEPGSVPAAELLLLRLKGGTLTPAARWPLPPDLRWVEPLRLRGGEEGWLALIGSRWYAGRPLGTGLSWKLLCACETLFSAGEGYLPFRARFAADLDGDGTSEVLLPHWRGLIAYRFDDRGGKLEAIWRVSWGIREKYNVNNDQLSVTLTLPRYQLEDVDGDGVRDFVMIESNRVYSARQPAPAPPGDSPFYVLDGEKLGQLRRLPLPPAFREALEAMEPGSYASPAEFVRALNAGPGGSPDASPADPAPANFAPADLRRVLEVAREPVPVLFPRRVSLFPVAPGTGREKNRIHTVGDMDGDGVLDLIHMKQNDADNLLDQKNQLRWFQGQRRDGLLNFDRRPEVFFSEGPAFAELVFPSTNGAAGPALFLATTDVTLMAVIRAFTLGTVSLDVFVYPWRDGKLVTPPTQQGAFTFQLKSRKKNNRPMILLADLNGDGWREYLFNLDTDSLYAYAGAAEGARFGAAPMVKTQVALPQRPETIFVGDLDQDGREELVLWYRRGSNPPKLRSTIRVLEFVEGN
ncbi:MAG: hypothetical protein V3S29_09275 [bacterium]